MGAAVDTLADQAVATAAATGIIEWRTMATRREVAASILADRDVELDRIGWALADARDGHGRAVVVEGPPGIGKTAVLTAARDLAARQGFRVLRARVTELDGASMRFLAFLLLRLEELRVAVLLSARPAEAGPGRGLLGALMMDPVTEVVTLGPLTTGGVARVIAAWLGREPEAGFAKACRDATGGTPFLVRTLVAALDEP